MLTKYLSWLYLILDFCKLYWFNKICVLIELLRCTSLLTDIMATRTGSLCHNLLLWLLWWLEGTGYEPACKWKGPIDAMSVAHLLVLLPSPCKSLATKYWSTYSGHSSVCRLNGSIFPQEGCPVACWHLQRQSYEEIVTALKGEITLCWRRKALSLCLKWNFFKPTISW